MRSLALLAVCAALAACTPDVDEKFENLKLTAALIQLRGAEAGAVMPLTRVNGIDPAATVCILGPYEQEGEGPVAAALNETLKQANYVAGADHWAVVQLRPGGKIEVAVLRQKERQLAGLRAEGDARQNCAKAADITILPGRNREVMFLLAAPKEPAAPADSPVALRLSERMETKVSTPRLGLPATSSPPSPANGSRR